MQWDGNSQGQRHALAIVDPIYHDHPELFTPASPRTRAMPPPKRSISIHRQLLRNYGGAGERWLLGTGNQWYFIKPNGAFFRWDGTPIMPRTWRSLRPPLFHPAERLYAAQPSVPVALAGNQLTIDPARASSAPFKSGLSATPPPRPRRHSTWPLPSSPPFDDIGNLIVPSNSNTLTIRE